MRAIILDDELSCAESLYILLQKYCPEVGILAVETDPEKAMQKTLEFKPELLFLDIELQTTNAFDFLLNLNYSFGVIFTTAYDRYALKAIKFDAIEYLLKPIDAIELVKAVEKAKHRLKDNRFAIQSNSAKIFLEKITVSTTEGLTFLNLASVIRFQSEGSYTHVITENSSNNLLISKNLAAIQKRTKYGGFSRVHKSHLINLRHVVKYLRGEGGEVLLSNGDKVPIARDRKDDFLSSIQGM